MRLRYPPGVIHSPGRPRLKPLLLPVEHGGWGLIGAPILLGLIVAPSLHGGLISAAALLLFLSRQPLKIAAKDILRKKSFPRTSWAGGFALAEIGLGVILLAVAYSPPSLLPLVILALLSAAQFALETFGKGRAILPELVGSAAAAVFATLITLTGGTEPKLAWLFAGALTVHAWLAVVYVTRRLNHHESTRAVGLSASAAVGLAAVVCARGALGWPLLAGFAILAGRALWGVSKLQTKRRAQIVGVQEVCYTLLLVVALILAR